MTKGEMFLVLQPIILFPPLLQRSKAHLLLIKKQSDHAGRAIAVLGNVNFSNIFFFWRRFNPEAFIHGFAVNEHNHVRVLFNGA